MTWHTSKRGRRWRRGCRSDARSRAVDSGVRRVLRPARGRGDGCVLLPPAGGRPLSELRCRDVAHPGRLVELALAAIPHELVLRVRMARTSPARPDDAAGDGTDA